MKLIYRVTIVSSHEVAEEVLDIQATNVRQAAESAMRVYRKRGDMLMGRKRVSSVKEIAQLEN